MLINKMIESEFRKLLKSLGEDPHREGLKKTAQKAVESFKRFTSGYTEDLGKITSGAVYDESGNNLVVLKNIEFYSLCEHHLLPFFGKCYIGYVPDGKVIGLSRLPRIVGMYSRRLALQERITDQIAKAIDKTLDPKGVAVVMDAAHTCMMMENAANRASNVVTSSFLGSFAKSRKTREEFFMLIGY